MTLKSKLKPLPRNKVQIIKLRNRKGYAAICLNNLTEGPTPSAAIARLKYPLRRMGYEIGRIA